MTTYHDPAGNIIGEREHSYLSDIEQKAGPIPSGFTWSLIMDGRVKFFPSVGVFPPEQPVWNDEQKAFWDRWERVRAAERKQLLAEEEKKRAEAITKAREQRKVVYEGDGEFWFRYDECHFVVGNKNVLDFAKDAAGKFGPMRVTIEFIHDGKATP